LIISSGYFFNNTKFTITRLISAGKQGCTVYWCHWYLPQYDSYWHGSKNFRML